LALPGLECQMVCTQRVDEVRGKPTSPQRLAPGQSESMKFRPLHDRVVIRRLNAEEKSSGGIIIPDTAQEKPMEGEVVAAGPGARNEQGHIVALEVKSGDRILFGKWSGTEVKLDGEELLIMKESDIMGIIEGSPAAKKKAA
jgi:chaperonin GroES